MSVCWLPGERPGEVSPSFPGCGRSLPCCVGSQLFVANLLISRGATSFPSLQWLKPCVVLNQGVFFILVTEHFPGDVTFLFSLWVQLLALLPGVPSAKVPLAPR